MCMLAHVYICMCACVCLVWGYTHTYNSYLPVIGVHEMRGRMHPNYCQITILLVVDLCSSLASFMMIQPLPIADKLPIKLWLLGNYQQTRVHMCTCAHIHTSTYNPTPNSHTLHMCMYVNTQHTYACTC